MTSPTPERRQLVILELQAKARALGDLHRRIGSELSEVRTILKDIYGVAA